MIYVFRIMKIWRKLKALRVGYDLFENVVCVFLFWIKVVYLEKMCNCSYICMCYL